MKLPSVSEHGLIGLIAAMILVLLPAFASAGPRDAYGKVEKAIADFRSRDFETADQKLREAALDAPDEHRITFDRACVLAAGGDRETAANLFRQAALGDDPALAAESYYNLAGLDALEAQRRLGEAPLDVEPPARKQIVKLLAAAASRYRTCLDMAPTHDAAHYNLEVVRLAKDRLQNAWAEKDRRDRFAAMNFSELLDHVENRQRDLRTASRRWAATPPSVKQRVAVADAADSTRVMLDAIEILNRKIPAALTQEAAAHAPGGPAAVPPPRDPEAHAQKIRAMTALADQAAQAMTSAAARLDANHPAKAVADEQTAIERLDAVRTIATPFEELVHRAVQKQEPLVESAAGGAITDHDDAAWEQQFVTRWSRAISEKAREELPSVEQQLAQLPPGEPAVDGPVAGRPEERAAAEDASTTGDAAAEAAGQAPEAPDDPRKRLEALKAAMEHAIGVGPRIVEASGAAARHLAASRTPEAVPHGEEALRLLKEIEELLPKNQQNQDQKPNEQQNQQNDDQQNQGQGDQNQQSQQGQDSGNEQSSQEDKQQNGESESQDPQQSSDREPKDGKDQENPDRSAGEEESNDQEEERGDKDKQADHTDAEKEDDPQREPRSPRGGDQEQTPKPQPSESGDPSAEKTAQGKGQALSPDEIEAMLRRVRQAQQDAREKQRAIEIYLQQSVPVEKDW